MIVKKHQKNMDNKKEVSTYSNKGKTSDIWRANDGVLCVCLSQNFSEKNHICWKITWIGKSTRYIADFFLTSRQIIENC